MKLPPLCLALAACGKLSLGALEGPSDAGDGAALPDAPSPPPQDGCGATSRCWALRTQYAEVLERARTCSVTATDACRFKVLDSLGCSRCLVHVNDDSALGPLRAEFQRSGCDQCNYTARAAFRGEPDQGGTCPPIVCVDPGAPRCTLPGSIDMIPKDGYCDGDALPTCPANLVNGSACSSQYQVCFGGPHNACNCPPPDPPHWSCF
jgi:hypothetical protein